MTIEKLEGTSPRLYSLVAPLVMRRSILRQNNNYPYWTSKSHVWFVAQDADQVVGFVPVETTASGVVKIDNYYVSGDDGQLLSLLLKEVVLAYGNRSLQGVVHARHTPVFRTEGFAPVREWKRYVKMEYRKTPQP